VNRRVVVTGRGIVSPIGNTIAEFWKNLMAGMCGVEKLEIDQEKFSDIPAFAATVKNFDPSSFLSKKEARRIGRVTQFTIHACEQAIREADILNQKQIRNERIGVILGTGIGGVVEILKNHEVFLKHGLRGVNPMILLMGMPNALSGELAIRYGFTGPSFTVNSACASSGHAIGDAFGKIKEGVMDICITGGSEAILYPHILMSFSFLGVFSKTGTCRPFDLNRDGIVLGEGSSIFVLEELEHAKAREAHIYGEILGYGMSSDAYHQVAPDQEGRGAALAMKAALQNANCKPENIQLINAHATGTKIGDIAEANALNHIFGDPCRIPVSANKPSTGHLIGASGAVELTATLLSLEYQRIPPTINHEIEDPECRLDCVPHKSRDHAMHTAISNSFGFGGHNISLVVSKY